jgi:hypothetical protein
LSKHNAQWFLKQGFVKMDIRELPEKRQALFDHQRNSSVFFSACFSLTAMRNGLCTSMPLNLSAAASRLAPLKGST